MRFNLLASSLSTVNNGQFFNEAFAANNREALSERAYYVRENDWCVFFQQYCDHIPGMQNLDEEAFVKVAKVSVRFAKCVGYGVRTHIEDIDTNFCRSGSQGEKPRYLDMFDIALMACKPPDNEMDEPFATSYFQAYLGAINLMRAYLRYNEDFNVDFLIRWTQTHRADLGLTATEYIAHLVAKLSDSQASGGLQLIDNCLPLAWNQMNVEQGYSSECSKKCNAARGWDSAMHR